MYVCIPMPAFSLCTDCFRVRSGPTGPDWSEVMLFHPDPASAHAADLALSILDTLPVASCSNDACAFVPSLFALLLARRAAASICFFVCWYIVLAYAIGSNSPSISYCEGGEDDVWSVGVCAYEDEVEVDIMEDALWNLWRVGGIKDLTRSNVKKKKVFDWRIWEDWLLMDMSSWKETRRGLRFGVLVEKDVQTVLLNMIENDRGFKSLYTISNHP